MTTFPALRPAVRTWTPGEYPHAQLNSISGRSRTVRLSSVMLRSQLRLTFAAISQAQMLSIAAHYLAQQGGYLGFDLPTEVWSGATASDFTLAGHQWRYSEPPTVEDLPCGSGYAVELRLESVPNEGASVAGLNAFVSIGLVTGAAAGAVGASLAVAVGLAAGGATSSGNQAYGASLTVAVGLAAGAGSSTDRFAAGGTFTVTASLAPGSATATTATDPNFSSVSLLLHMDGSNNSTTFTDSSSVARSVAAYGNAKISTTESKFGGASAFFDGSGDYLVVQDANDLDLSGDFTVELWIRQDSSPTETYPILMEKGNGSELSNSWGLIINNSATDKTCSFFWGSPRQYLFLGNITNGQWCHAAVSRSGSTCYAFLNGAQGASPATISTDFSSAYDLRIGMSGNGYNSYKGYVDDLRITKGVARYTSNFTPPAAAYPNS